MKKLLLVIAICYITTNSYAQTNPVIGTYTNDVDAMFQHLNKSEITTGILYDRVFPFANLPFFNVTTNQPDTVDFSFFIQGCSEVRRAAYTYNTTLPPTADYFYAVEKQAALINTVNISVFSYNYNYIDTSSIENGLLYKGSDSLFYDVPGRPYSPYVLKQTTVVSPIDSALDYATGQFSFTFNDSNYYHNHSKLINRVIINFNDGGGDRILTSGSSYSPAYPSNGEKICRATVEFTDGTSSTNYFVIVIKNAGSGFRLGNPVPDDTKSFLATRGFMGYDETITRYAQANIGIYYADQTPGIPKRIKKPIIITDGIDFNQERRFRELNRGFLKYEENNSTKFLVDELNLKGYDVILLDYDDVTDRTVLLPNKPTFKQPGADYVERNAMVVVDVIEWANSELASQSITEKLVIVGPSMGGLVTRYALRWMETNNLNHNCRLWVSFDAPHRGANIPIGSQYTLEFFAVYGENEDAKKSIATKLDAPAAKEFIIHHYSANSVAQAGAPGFRDRFNTELENLGWPQATGLRRVSLVNGNLSGILTNTPEQKSLEVEGKPSRWFGQFLTFLVRAGNLRVLGSESYFTSNSYTSNRVFYGFKYGFTRNDYYTKVAVTPNGSCSIDNSPGGIYDTQQQIADQIPSEVKVFGFRIGLKVLAIVPTHSFIPTKSALGSYNFINWCENLYNRNLVCSNEIPFDNYYAPVSNSEPHVFLSSQNVQWMFNELDGTPQPAPSENPYIIQLQSGSEPLCSSATYNICPASNATVTWTISNPNIASIPSPSNGNSVIVTAIGSGTVILSATAGSFTITKTINVGLPSISGNYITQGQQQPLHIWFGDPSTDYNNVCNLENTSTNMQITGATSVTWSKITSNPSNVSWSQNGNNLNFYLWAVGQTAIFRIEATNGCGTFSYDFGFKSIQCGGGGGGCDQFSVSPNPATSSINIIVPNIPIPCDGVSSGTSKTTTQRTITEVRIYDQTGNLKKVQKENKTKQTRINLTGLKTGVYVVEITDGTYKERHQLIIQ